MSKSRLEKFLYALYSLDSSDLPNPLSRIEELYKCWVTGEEAPTFEPLSRVEKYLMAILGAYDADSLPNPLSRVEVLLYKLATGDDNLDDVKSFLSEHEELLAEIIRNGGAGGNINIEYVLYTLSTEHNTLYNTAEKPVKSAILKGDTEVTIGKNLFNGKLENGGYSDSTGEKMVVGDALRSIDFIEVEPSSTICCSNNGTARATNICEYDENKKFLKFIAATKKLILSSSTKYVTFYGGNNDRDKMQIEYGEEPTYYEEYKQTLTSVQMPVLKTTGKNLFDINSMSNINNWDTVVSGVIPYCSYKINLKPNTTYTFSQKQFLRIEDVYASFGLEKGGYEPLLAITHPTSQNSTTFKLTTDDRGLIYVKLYRANTTLETFISKLSNNQLQLEESSTATSYEPFKSNILTLNEEVELCGIGDVKDELDLITGELTQRIGEYSLDGSSKNGKWVIRTDVYKEGYIYFQQELNYILQSENIAICNRLPYSNQSDISSEQLRLSVYNNESRIGVRLSESKGVSSLDEFSEYLKSNPIKFKYPLATASIKTVDLSLVDQDGNNTKLKTFDDITHVILSSEGLIPEAELEVATKNEEDLEDSVVYAVHTLSEEHNTLYNTAEKPVKSAILKGNTDENLQSVKMPVLTTTGKNLFPTNNFIECETDNRMIGQYIYEVYLKSGDYCSSYVHADDSDKDTVLRYKLLDEQGNQVLANSAVDRTFTIENDGLYKLQFGRGSIYNGLYTKIQVQLEEGSTATTYEPFKSNILTVNEDVKLCSIGDVKDELNLLTGEVVQSVYNLQLTGDEGWVQSVLTNDDYLLVYTNFTTNLSIPASKVICDKLDYNSSVGLSTPTTEGINIIGDCSLRISLSKTKVATLSDFINWIRQEQPEINFITKEKSIKTVDLSVVDQDGNNTELKTFNDITYVTLSSEGLIPEAELEVAEKVPEVAASMLTISREQEAIDTTTNEQSENVDATMIATTEIYEGLL